MSHSEPLSSGASAIEPGLVLLGKYRIERVIAKGGMGQLVEARHLALDERVALKFLLPHLVIVPDAVERFMREARAAIRIKSEHIARVMDVATLESGEPFLVLEYLDGRDLHHIVKHDGPLPLADALDTLLQACHALAEAHALGIIHRDIKPGNLFRARAPDGGSIVKVLDFGLSKVIGSKGIDPLTRTQATMGSAHYMAPEQMHSLRDVDHRADVYSLGVTLYWLLTGKHPYPGNSLPAVYAAVLTGRPPPIRETRGDVPEPLERAITKAFARDAAARYQSVGELVLAIAPFASAQSRATLDRISRLVARPMTGPAVVGVAAGGTVILPDGAPMMAGPPAVAPAAPAVHAPPPASAPRSVPGAETALANAQTRLLPPRRRASNAPLVIAFVLLGGAFIIAGLAVAVPRSCGRSTDVEISTAPEVTPAPAPTPEATGAAADPSTAASSATATPASAEPASSTPAAAAAEADAGGAPVAPKPQGRWPPPPRTSAAPAASKPSPFDMR